MKEYRFVKLRCRFFTGTYDTGALGKELNRYAEEGWQVHSMTPDNASAFGKSKYLIVLLEREKA